jgi:RNA polymerase sigma-70 factor (ECF subfamily)
MKLKIYRAKEHELIRDCRQGNRNAQRDLYDMYSSKMYALCYRYVRNPMEAEDIMVIAFMKVFDHIGQFKGEGSFEGWIRRIMVNEALSHLRKNRNMYLETDIEYADQQPHYEEHYNQLEADDLVKMIQELPAGYRTVFNMYAIDGYAHKEIAEQLGITESTSKSQLNRARAYLKKMLLELEKVTEQKLGNDESSTR